MKRFLSGVILILLASLLLPLSTVMALPVPSQYFSGNATLDGSPAPDGTPVTATFSPASGSWAVATTTSGGSYSLTIPDSGSALDTDVGNVTFTLNGLGAGSSPFVSGDVTTLDLSATSPITQYTLTINTSGNGSTTGAGTHDEGSGPTITATPQAGWEFTDWTGDVGTVDDVNAASTTITMNDNYTITANFTQLPQHTLTVDSSTGGSTSPSGGSTRYEGEVVSVTAIPGVGYQFDGWTGDTVASPNSASTTTTMDADRTITANFVTAPDVTLTMEVNGNGTTTPEPGDSQRQANEVVDITAIPDEGYVFVNWTGGVANPNSSSTTVLMDANKTVTANFALAGQVTLTIETNGSGTTTPAPGIVHSYSEGTVVNITATPDFGWSFDGWTGNVANPNSASTTVLMDADKTITANFVAGGDITPPVISGVSAANVTRTSADITWTTNEPGDSQVDYEASPGVLTPLDGTMVAQHLVRLTGLSPFTTYSYMVMSRDAAGNLTTSAIFTFTTLGAPASFVLSNWDISITEIGEGRQASITFLLDNVGDLLGSYEVVMTINGVEEDSQVIELEAGGSQTVSFSTTKTAPGSYSTDVNSISFSFTVPALSEPVEVGLSIKWPVVGGIAGGVILILAIILLLLKRRYYILVRK